MPHIVIVEPNFYGREFIYYCKQKGYQLTLIISDEKNPQTLGYADDFDGDTIVADTLSYEETHDALEAYDNIDNVDALIAGYEYVLPITARLCETFNFFSNRYETMQKARIKNMAKAQWKKDGVSTADFYLAKGVDALRQASSTFPYPYIIKPVDGSCSENVFFIENDADFSRAIDILQEYKTSYMNMRVLQNFLIERYIQGPEYSVELFLQEGKEIWASATEKQTTAPDFFVETQHVLPLPEGKEIEKVLVDESLKAAHSLQYRHGPAHVEIKMKNDIPYIIEFNGRPGGDMITTRLLRLALGIDFYGAHIEQSLGKKLPSLQPTKHRAASIAYFFAPETGYIDEINGLDTLGATDCLVEYKFNARAGDFVKKPEFSDDRIGYVIALADTPQEAKKAAALARDSVTIKVRDVN